MYLGVPMLMHISTVRCPALAALFFAPTQIPPFRSVPHLHMHAQVLPFVSPLRALKYRAAGDPDGDRKGLSWYVTATQAARILEGGGRVRVRPCGALREQPSMA